jgi:hypothetical protein
LVAYEKASSLGQPNPQKGQEQSSMGAEQGWHDNKSQQERKCFLLCPHNFFFTVCCPKLASTISFLCFVLFIMNGTSSVRYAAKQKKNKNKNDRL